MVSNAALKSREKRRVPYRDRQRGKYCQVNVLKQSQVCTVSQKKRAHFKTV